MKVKNEYVQIKVGEKTYTKKNMILNEFIKRIFKSQINASYKNFPVITECYIKLDTPLENIDYDSELSYDDFNIKIISRYYQSPLQEVFDKFSTKTKNCITLMYKFTNDYSFIYRDEYGNDEQGTMNQFNRFIGRKVTAIGFGCFNTCLAVADVSNMNIILNKNEEFIISRVDTYQSDAICDGYDYPLHLINFKTYREEGTNDTIVAQLYSIGLGNKIGLMESEVPINFENLNVEDDNVSIPYYDNIKVGNYPSNELNLGFYPTGDNSKYLMLRYRLYRIDLASNKTYINKSYTMSYPYDYSKYDGQAKSMVFNLKIERS